MIYTSYFAGYKGDRGISIARKTPKWFNGNELMEFAPSWSLINIKDNQEEYTRRYHEEVLKNITNNLLMGLKDGDVLLCWESPDKFCHRHIVAEWLIERGIEAKELTKGKR